MAQKLNRQWIVWLDSDEARAFLNLEPQPRGETSQNRFYITGSVTGEADSEIGFWIDINSIKERTVPGNYVVNEWTIEPKRCLIRWEVVSLIQEGSDESVGALQVVTPAA